MQTDFKSPLDYVAFTWAKDYEVPINDSVKVGHSHTHTRHTHMPSEVWSDRTVIVSVCVCVCMCKRESVHV